jgi:type II secretory pathway pseudopilin PulG
MTAAPTRSQVPPPPRTRITGHHDRGETLIELLVAIVILGLGTVAIVGGILISVDSSTMHRNQAQAQALLHSWAERISAVTDATYTPCAGTGAFGSPPNGTVPTGFGTQVTQVQYWDPSTSGFVTACSTDSGVQRVRLTVTAPSGLYPGFSQSLDVVVRWPCSTATSC